MPQVNSSPGLSHVRFSEMGACGQRWRSHRRAVWAGISYAINAEIGWIAWGIGFVVGFYGAWRVKTRKVLRPGVTAAVIAIVAVLAGKYLAIHLLVSSMNSGGAMPQLTDERMTSILADDDVNGAMRKVRRFSSHPASHWTKRQPRPTIRPRFGGKRAKVEGAGSDRAGQTPGRRKGQIGAGDGNDAKPDSSARICGKFWNLRRTLVFPGGRHGVQDRARQPGQR